MTAPGACVIAQQYYSATIVSMRFYSRNKTFGTSLKNIII
jgi:hypothetical protein